jgi:hypothetical protein
VRARLIVRANVVRKPMLERHVFIRVKSTIGDVQLDDS